MVPIARPRDAVGRMALALQSLGRERKWRSLLFTERQGSPRVGKMFFGSLRRGLLQESPAWAGEPAPRVSLYHHSIGTVVADRFLRWPAEKKILVYHNITPAELPYLSERTRADLVWGREQLRELVAGSHVQIALSNYSARELMSLGAKNVKLLPYLIWRRTFTPRPSRAPLVLVVGRVEPHKRVMEALQAFRVLHETFSSAKLFVVGNLKGSPEYSESLRRYIAENGLTRGVKLTGRVSDRTLRRLYERASALLVLSDHEGFCVPVAEAILARLPVVAHPAGAIAETLGAGGLLLNDRDPVTVAAALDLVLRDGATRSKIIEGQKLEATRFRPDVFMDGLTAAMRELGEIP